MLNLYIQTIHQTTPSPPPKDPWHDDFAIGQPELLGGEETEQSYSLEAGWGGPSVLPASAAASPPPPPPVTSPWVGSLCPASPALRLFLPSLSLSLPFPLIRMAGVLTLLVPLPRVPLSRVPPSVPPPVPPSAPPSAPMPCVLMPHVLMLRVSMTRVPPLTVPQLVLSPCR